MCNSSFFLDEMICRQLPTLPNVSYATDSNSPQLCDLKFLLNRIGDVIVSMLASSAVCCGFEPWSVQCKDYEFGICYFSSKHPALWSK